MVLLPGCEPNSLKPLPSLHPTLVKKGKNKPAALLHLAVGSLDVDGALRFGTSFARGHRLRKAWGKWRSVAGAVIEVFFFCL